ncbi:carbohydrate ABC transporter permease [Georgenia sp. AZ-5]|uniref:carbohydrate ABC transporter permease n=1 Tax=Georgenia sp. AZ-5 TaxID=3367526 RepID=UPI0037548D4C
MQLTDLLESRVVLALVVVLVVPAVLVAYVLVVEAVVGHLPKRVSAGVRPWLWLAPALVFLGVFLIYPTIATVIRSFFSRRGDAFTGLENYQWFFTRDDTLLALRNNVLWAVLLPLLVVGLGLLIAVLVDRVRYEVVVKSVVFLPMAISFVAAGVIWRLMYEINPEVGTLNAVVTGLGGPRVGWLSTAPWNNVMLVLVGVWMLTGLAMVILSAGLKGISPELLEAARIDGANERQVFRYVILPLLSPTIAVVATTVIIFALKTFDIVYVMTNGNFGTEVIANRMYKELFANGQQGRAATVAVVLLLATVPIMLLNVKRFRQQEERR